MRRCSPPIPRQYLQVRPIFALKSILRQHRRVLSRLERYHIVCLPGGPRTQASFDWINRRGTHRQYRPREIKRVAESRLCVWRMVDNYPVRHRNTSSCSVRRSTHRCSLALRSLLRDSHVTVEQLVTYVETSTRMIPSVVSDSMQDSHELISVGPRFVSNFHK